jgi:hypothetical protein
LARGYRGEAAVVWRGRSPIARKLLELAGEFDEQAAGIEKIAERN